MRMRTPVLVVLCLTAVGARGQQNNDAAHAIALGEIRLAGDLSTAPATRPIPLSFSADTETVHWYSLNVVEEPSSAICFGYGHLRLLSQITGFPATTSGTPNLLLNVYADPSLTLFPAEDVAGNPYLVESDFYSGSTCGSTTLAYIRVQRNGGATPVTYTLNLSLDRFIAGAPKITSIAPTTGPIGTAVTISGSSLLPQVKFQELAATITDSRTANNGIVSLTALVPAGAKTGPISVFNAQSQQAFTVTAPSPNIRNGDSLSGALSASGPAACCAVTPNAALAGRLGRLVVAFPPSTVPTGTRIDVLKDGKELQNGYGNQSWDLFGGTYDLKVSGKLVANVAVQARSDTNVRVGVLRVSASGQTRWEVLDGGTAIANGYGNALVGLPVGMYSLRISGQAESFTIRDGQVVDF